MNAAEMVQEVYSSLEQKDTQRALSLLAEDFVFSGATPVPLDRHQWVGVISAFTAAMPDFSFGYRFRSEEGGHVEGTVELTGTQVNELVLPMPGIPHVAATGIKVALPRETVELDTRGDQIISLKVENLPNGGVPGILKQLGVSLPQVH
jgi:hypothetical protein